MIRIVFEALFEKVDPANHIKVSIVIVIKLDRQVVRQVPRLMLPNGNKVRLQLGDLFQRGRIARPVFDLLIVICLLPQQSRCHASHTERRQPNRLAGRIDFAQVRLAQIAVGAQLCQFAAKAPFSVRRGEIAHRRAAQPRQRKQQDGDRQTVARFAIERLSLTHLATSRVRKKK